MTVKNNKFVLAKRDSVRIPSAEKMHEKVLHGRIFSVGFFWIFLSVCFNSEQWNGELFSAERALIWTGIKDHFSVSLRNISPGHSLMKPQNQESGHYITYINLYTAFVSVQAGAPYVVVPSPYFSLCMDKCFYFSTLTDWRTNPNSL